MRTSALLLVLQVVVAVPGALPEKLQVAPPRENDTFATGERGHEFRVQHGELATGHFQIAGVDLTFEEDVFKQAARVLGPVQIRSTGDAADADGRVCYRPTDKDDATRLYFHAGEVTEWFVLSSATPASERTDVCRPSSKVSKSLSTASGLHLGQTVKQVIAILGLPTRRSHDAKTGFDAMTYEFETRKKASISEMAAARKANPGMTEEKLLESYGYDDLEESIELKFSEGLLTELNVSWSAQD
jgi:hypothetical protein